VDNFGWKRQKLHSRRSFLAKKGKKGSLFFYFAKLPLPNTLSSSIIGSEKDKIKKRGKNDDKQKTS
jgi:hypothetical protein